MCFNELIKEQATNAEKLWRECQDKTDRMTGKQLRGRSKTVRRGSPKDQAKTQTKKKKSKDSGGSKSSTTSRSSKSTMSSKTSKPSSSRSEKKTKKKKKKRDRGDNTPPYER